MANQLLTIGMITREAIRLWSNYNAFLKGIDTQYDDQFARTGAKIGSQLRIRLPVDFTVRTGAAASFQDVSEQFTTLTMATQNGVDMSFPTIDLTLSIDDFAERYIAPAVNNLTGAVAVGVMSGAEGGVSNYVDLEVSGVIATPTNATFLNAGALLDSMSAPPMNRRIVLDPYTDARVAASLTGLFNPVSDISAQYRSGTMKNALGFDWMRDQTVIKHTPGTYSAGNVSGANQSGSAITVGSTTGTFKKGDIIAFSGVNSVNRITKQDNGSLAQFVVTANVPASSTSLPIYPALIPPSSTGQMVQYQTVTASPANNATITFYGVASGGTYRKNIAFVPEAVTMATADLEIPPDVQSAREQMDGISMRMVRQYVIGTDQVGTRLDIVWGALWIRPEWCVVIPDAI